MSGSPTPARHEPVTLFASPPPPPAQPPVPPSAAAAPVPQERRSAAQAKARGLVVADGVRVAGSGVREGGLGAFVDAVADSEDQAGRRARATEGGDTSRRSPAPGAEVSGTSAGRAGSPPGRARRHAPPRRRPPRCPGPRGTRAHPSRRGAGNPCAASSPRGSHPRRAPRRARAGGGPGRRAPRSRGRSPGEDVRPRHCSPSPSLAPDRSPTGSGTTCARAGRRAAVPSPRETSRGLDDRRTAPVRNTADLHVR
jgi:hypothetical protein